MTGIGGVFFKAHDAKTLAVWYRDHLGITFEGAESGAYHQFEWLEKDNPSKTGGTVWAVFPENAQNFVGSKSSLMIDYRVANLARLLVQLKSEGVQVEDKIDDAPYGRFGHAMDPEGNRMNSGSRSKTKPPFLLIEHLCPAVQLGTAAHSAMFAVHLS